MVTLTIKQTTLAKILWTLFAISYGFFIVAYLENHYILNSGDIVSLVDNFEAFGNSDGVINYYRYNQNILVSGDAIFRLGVLALQELLNLSSLAALGTLGFITSSIVAFIYGMNVRSRKNLFVVLILILMIFFTPRVENLFASGVRSGLAFTVLVAAMTNFNGAKQYILFLLSTLVHSSMAPMIFFYALFHWLDNRKMKLPYTGYLLFLALCSCCIAVTATQLTFTYRGSGVNQSILYMSLVMFVGIFIIFTNKTVIRNVYGFISVGLVMIIFFGYLIDFSFIRYIGNAILLYLLFILKEGTTRTIHVFTVAYLPFFVLTTSYSISNYW